MQQPTTLNASDKTQGSSLTTASSATLSQPLPSSVAAAATNSLSNIDNFLDQHTPKKSSFKNNNGSHSHSFSFAINSSNLIHNEKGESSFIKPSFLFADNNNKYTLHTYALYYLPLTNPCLSSSYSDIGFSSFLENSGLRGGGGGGVGVSTAFCDSFTSGFFHQPSQTNGFLYPQQYYEPHNPSYICSSQMLGGHSFDFGGGYSSNSGVKGCNYFGYTNRTPNTNQKINQNIILLKSDLHPNALVAQDNESDVFGRKEVTDFSQLPLCPQNNVNLAQVNNLSVSQFETCPAGPADFTGQHPSLLTAFSFNPNTEVLLLQDQSQKQLTECSSEETKRKECAKATSAILPLQASIIKKINKRKCSRKAATVHAVVVNGHTNDTAISSDNTSQGRNFVSQLAQTEAQGSRKASKKTSVACETESDNADSADFSIADSQLLYNLPQNKQSSCGSNCTVLLPAVTTATQRIVQNRKASSTSTSTVASSNTIYSFTPCQTHQSVQPVSEESYRSSISSPSFVLADLQYQQYNQFEMTATVNQKQLPVMISTPLKMPKLSDFGIVLAASGQQKQQVQEELMEEEEEDEEEEEEEEEEDDIEEGDDKAEESESDEGNEEEDDGATKKKPRSKANCSDAKPCNCRNSKCLKRYCDCFAAGLFCQSDCKCEECHNKPEYEDERQKAILKKKKRIKDAFLPVIHNNSHIKGCHCKNSHCLKKYCVCHQNGVMCSSLCQCVDCENKVVPGSDDHRRKRRRKSSEPVRIILTTPSHATAKNIIHNTALNNVFQMSENIYLQQNFEGGQPQQQHAHNHFNQLNLLESPYVHNHEANECDSQMDIEFPSTSKKGKSNWRQNATVASSPASHQDFSTLKKPSARRRSGKQLLKQKPLSLFNDGLCPENVHSAIAGLPLPPMNQRK